MIILIATQRSGTNMLRRILDTHERIRTVPEVFNDSFESREAMPKGVPFFMEYLLEKAARAPRQMLPQARPDVVVEYLEMLETAVGDKVGIVDVKYNSLHHADSVWSRPCGPPRLLELFRERGYRVIHLTRRNHLAVALSLQRASRTGVFAVPASQALETQKLVVDPAAMMRRVGEIKADAEVVRRWLRGSGVPLLEVAYEDLFVGEPGSELDPDDFNRVAQFVGVSGEGLDLVPPTKKIGPLDIGEEVENIEELARAFAGTEYERYFSADARTRSDPGAV